MVRKGHDAALVKANRCSLMDERGAEYPAEHNVGHAYVAKPALRDFYRSLDPCNCFNPGIGATPRQARWRSPSETTSDTSVVRACLGPCTFRVLFQ